MSLFFRFKGPVGPQGIQGEVGQKGERGEVCKTTFLCFFVTFLCL